MISQPNSTSTLQCVKKAGVLWEKTRVFPKKCKRRQITNSKHIPKNPGHYNVHCTIILGKQLSA
jgi:hypothetical protein